MVTVLLHPRFVERRLASGRYDHLGIAWFGGEPLLAPDIIDELSARFMELAERFGIGYDAMIHTNGYLLDQEMVDFLEARNVRTAIVPIDGMGEAHDATRHLVGGGPTFDVIMGNLLDEDGGAPDAWLGALGSKTRDFCFPSDQPQCLECKFLPCCLGGCPVQRIEEGVPECPSALFDPDSFAIERLMETGRYTPSPAS